MVSGPLIKNRLITEENNFQVYFLGES
jgi:hypothetical protein